MASTAAAGTIHKGVWEPLSHIVYGYAIYPLSPAQIRDNLPPVLPKPGQSDASRQYQEDERERAAHEIVALELGDEIYAFERYTPKAGETRDVWYRGYVWCPARHEAASGTDLLTAKTTTPDDTQVFIGIFPASHIHVRDFLADAEGRLSQVYSALTTGSDPYSAIAAARGMETVREEDEEETTRNSVRMSGSTRPPTVHSIKSPYSLMHLQALRASTPSAASAPFKFLPPRPSLKSGDDTQSGSSQPIIDEVSSAIREWYNLMFLYLSRREYALFHLVKEHIEALHLGRRQLLAQTLSVEETTNLRRDCVARLVTCNVVQGLDVIVRHPNWGGLVTVDVEGEIDPQSWVSATRMYAMQASLAYMDVGDGTARPAAISSSLDLPHPIASSFSTSNSVFPDLACRLVNGSSTPNDVPAPVKFFQVFLDMQAFVASPSLPGETAQLYFALYSKTEGKFLSEDFCAILNHNGVLAREAEQFGGAGLPGIGRVKTLFIDLSPHDVAGPIYLVCRIVRDGGMKLGNVEGGRRGTELRSRIDNPTHAMSGASFAELETPVTPGQSGLQSPSPGQDGFGNAHFRRPFGCAVLELTELAAIVADGTDASSLREHTMPIYVPVQDDSFSTLHQDIISGRTKEYERSPRATMVAVSVKAFHGDAKTIVRENPSLMQDAPLTQRLGFPDVVFPGDVRNELYVKLWNGEFKVPSRKSIGFANAAANMSGPASIEVTVEVRTNNAEGSVVESAISQGSGEPPVTQFRSLVFYKTNTPSFGELIKITLPVDLMPNCHLFFTFRARSSRDSSNDVRPFAFAFLPLFPEQNAFLQDGSHTLILYRVTKPSHIPIQDYWGAPQTLRPGQALESLQIPNVLLKTAVPLRDKFTVRSQLCSTKFTQNPVVLGLVRWETVDAAQLTSILTQFPYVGELEIAKFLRDIFDALFGILTHGGTGAGPERDDLVFNCLIHVLGIIQDRRFSNFQPVLEVYIEKHFSNSSAYPRLLQSMQRLLANPLGTETAQRLRAAFRAWQYVFKFTVRSREFQRRKEEGVGSESTTKHLEQVFKKEVLQSLEEINKLMTMTQSSAIGTQTFAVQNFTSILPDLGKVFTADEVVKIVKNFTNALAGAKGRMVVWKLVMFVGVVRSYLFDIPTARTELVEDICNWIMPHLGKFDEHAQGSTEGSGGDNTKDSARIGWLEAARLSVSVVALILDKLQQNLVNPTVLADRKALSREYGNVDYLLDLLPRLLDTYVEFQSPPTIRAFERHKCAATTMSAVPVVFPASHPFALVSQYPPYMLAGAAYEVTPFFNCTLGETAVVFLSLVLSSPRKSIVNLFDTRLEVQGKDNTAALLSQFFKVAVSIIENEAFPRTWLNVNILAHRVLLKLMEPVSMLLMHNFIPDHTDADSFKSELWRDAFYMLLSLLSSEQLVIEEHSPQKRRAVWRLAGDIRGDGALIMLQLWEALGYSAPANPRYDTYQSALGPLMGQVVHLCLSHHELLRVNAVQILYSMIVLHYNSTGNFDEIEHEITNKLDSLFMNEAKGTDITRAFFVSQLRQLFDSSAADDRLRERVNHFLNSVDTFLDLLLSLRTLPPGEEYHDDRVIATLRLLNFTRQLGKDDIYIKYVHQLVNMHLASQNYVEAALSLKLHADLHDWDVNVFVEPLEELGLPRQSRFHRKETLCLQILDCLGRGRAWETAIEICKDLAYQHAEVTFNYQRLAEVLHHQATLLDHIIHEPRYYADYFRVAFYGDFPDAIRDKEFIYRGFEWEKFGAFCERMLAKHPGAQLLRSGVDPSDEIRQGSAQWIQCMSVTPEPDRTMAIFTQPDVPSAVRTYYEHCAINTFSISRQYNKTDAQPPQFQDIWTEKTYFLTEEAFPTVLRRSEVIDVRVAHVSPVEGAIQDLETKTKELVALNIRYSSMYETGAVGVQTNHLAASLNNVVDAPAPNIKTYREAFLNSDFISQNAQQLELIQKLRDTIDEHISYIDACLGLHAKLCPPEMAPFHQTLERLFRRNFADDIARLGLQEHPIPDPSGSNSLRNDHGGRFSPSVYSESEAHGSSYGGTPGATNVTSIQRSGSISVGRPSLSQPQSHMSIMSATTGFTSTTPGALSRSTTTRSAAARRQYGQPPLPPSILQKNLQNLAKFGMNAVASGPGDEGRDTMSGEGSMDGLPENPLESFMTVNGAAGVPHVPLLSPSLHGHGQQGSGASPSSPTSANGFTSQGSLSDGRNGSIGGRVAGQLSRFGSFSFGRRGSERGR